MAGERPRGILEQTGRRGCGAACPPPVVLAAVTRSPSTGGRHRRGRSTTLGGRQGREEISGQRARLNEKLAGRVVRGGL
eukprot:229398-Hanusia_phi.AAC.1